MIFKPGYYLLTRVTPSDPFEMVSHQYLDAQGDELEDWAFSDRTGHREGGSWAQSWANNLSDCTWTNISRSQFKAMWNLWVTSA